MIVRAVEIDKALADFFQKREGDRGVVDELAVRGNADGATDDDLGVLAGFEAAFFEDCVDFGRVCKIEDGLDGAGVLAGADEAFVGALSEDHFQGTDDDGFPGTRFARDRDEAGTQLPYEFVNEGEVSDFEKGEHAGNSKN